MKINWNGYCFIYRGMFLLSRDSVTLENHSRNRYIVCEMIVASHPFNLASPSAYWGFPGSSDGKASAYNAGDLGSIPGAGRSPGEGNGNPVQYSSLENSMDQGAWWASAHGFAKSRTWLSGFTSLLHTDSIIAPNLFCFSVPLCPCVMLDSATLWTIAHQTPLSTEFSQQESWSGLPFPSLCPHERKYRWIDRGKDNNNNNFFICYYVKEVFC